MIVGILIAVLSYFPRCGASSRPSHHRRGTVIAGVLWASGTAARFFMGLERDREKRYRNVGELALALIPFASERARASVEKKALIDLELASVRANEPGAPVAEARLTGALVWPATVSAAAALLKGSDHHAPFRV
jgi:hypothetical protein